MNEDLVGFTEAEVETKIIKKPKLNYKKKGNDYNTISYEEIQINKTKSINEAFEKRIE